MGFDEFRGFWGTGLEMCGTFLSFFFFLLLTTSIHDHFNGYRTISYTSFLFGCSIVCTDGLATPIGTVGTYFAKPLDDKFGPNLVNVLPGYFEQHPNFTDIPLCPKIQNISSTILSDEEKFIACKTRPRQLPKLLDLDLLDNVIDQISNHDYDKGPFLQYFSTANVHQPIAYPKKYDMNDFDSTSK